jgi:hypothetical protein
MTTLTPVLAFKLVDEYIHSATFIFFTIVERMDWLSVIETKLSSGVI